MFPQLDLSLLFGSRIRKWANEGTVILETQESGYENASFRLFILLKAVIQSKGSSSPRIFMRRGNYASLYDPQLLPASRTMAHHAPQVPNLECYCVGITRSGGTIVSGWSDGKIRAFYPESGKLKFVISDAHAEGVTAVALAHDDDTRPPWRWVS